MVNVSCVWFWTQSVCTFPKQNTLNFYTSELISEYMYVVSIDKVFWEDR